MAYFLSTGTAMTIAAATGDAGQLGMVAGFKGRLISLLMGLLPSSLGNFWEDDWLWSNSQGSSSLESTLPWFSALRADRLGGVLFLGFRQILRFRGCAALGDRPSAAYLRGRYSHPLSQHSVSQR